MSKETIVFVPGLLCNEVLWEKQIKFFDENFDCIVADVSQYNNVQDMASALNRQELGKFHLVGFSLGGWVALEFSQRYTQKISTLTILSADAGILRPDTRKVMEHMSQLVKDGFFEDLIKNIISTSIGEDQQTNQNLINRLLTMMRSQGPKIALNQLQALLNFNESFTNLCDLQLPVTMIYGQHDSHIDVNGLKKVVNEAPYGKLISMQGAGHFLPQEKPQELNIALAKGFSHVYESCKV